MGLLVAAISVVSFAAVASAEKTETATAKPSAIEQRQLAYLLQSASSSEAKVWKALFQPVTFDFQETPLEEAVAYLAEKVDCDVVIDETALSDVGLDPSVPVTVRANGLLLKSALKTMLERHDLTFCVEDGCLVITTPEAAAPNRLVMVFDVTSLAGDSPILSSYGGGYSTRGPSIPGMAAAPGMGAEENQGGGAFGAVPSPEIGACPAYDAASGLLDLLFATVEPTSWDTMGGMGSSAVAVIRGRTCIVVAQNTEVQIKVAELLARLETVAEKGADE
ncbi:MAG: hypothetical protein D6741_05525 [Planctomycetota bacterium]|nr:MAG: hypothetical protein D6741_05525 [Planctomycetota bacterium]